MKYTAKVERLEADLHGSVSVCLRDLRQDGLVVPHGCERAPNHREVVFTIPASQQTKFLVGQRVTVELKPIHTATTL